MKLKKLYSRKGIIITIVIMAVLTLVSIGLSPLVKINYDMREYLKDESKTKQAIIKLEEEFGNSSMIQMMTSNIDLVEASNIVSEINEMPMVKSVIWLGTAADINIPIDAIDESVVNVSDFYKDGKLLYTIEFMEDDYSLEVGKTIDKINDLMLSKEVEVSYRGPAVNNKTTRELVDSEMIMILAVAIPLAVLILFLASSSWLEPIVVLINLAVAIVINLGTNFLMPSVSYITMSIASILQLAMSLDYSLFIVHRYYEERDKGFDKIAAAVNSTKASFRSVTASAATTVVGFLALLLMRYQIGADIGLSLVKAIVISYLVTIFLLPVLLILLDKPLLKYKHKMFLPKFGSIVKVLHKGRYIIVIFFIILGASAFYLQSKTTYIYGDTPSDDMKLKLAQDRHKIKEAFGGFEPVVILYDKEDKTNVISLVTELEKLEQVSNIQSIVTSVDPSIPEEMIPKEALAQFKGINYYRMILFLNVDSETEKTYELSNQIFDLTDQYLEHPSYIAGGVVATTEIKETVKSDGIWVQLISAVAIALVILIVLRNPITPVILVLLIEVSIWINIAITFISGNVIIYIGFLVVTSLQLGATIDYAVLISSRYQEFRKTLDKKEAMIEAVKLSAPAIITSAAVLASSGFVVSIVSQLTVVHSIGLLIGRGALLSGVIVLFLLPPLLLAADFLIEKTNIKFKKIKTNKEGQHEKINE